MRGHVPALLLLSLASCSRTDDPAEAARLALLAGDHACALEHLEQAVDRRGPSEEEHYFLRFDRVVAAGVLNSEGLEPAIESFSPSGVIAPDEYRSLAIALVQEGAVEAAVHLMDEALRTYPNHDRLQRVHRLAVEQLPRPLWISCCVGIY